MCWKCKSVGSTTHALLYNVRTMIPTWHQIFDCLVLFCFGGLLCCGEVWGYLVPSPCSDAHSVCCVSHCLFFFDDSTFLFLVGSASLHAVIVLCVRCVLRGAILLRFALHFIVCSLVLFVSCNSVALLFSVLPWCGLICSALLRLALLCFALCYFVLLWFALL